MVDRSVASSRPHGDGGVACRNARQQAPISSLNWAVMPQAPPMPILDLSNDRFIVAVGLAARQHVSADVISRPRSTFGPEHRRWAAVAGRKCLYCGTPDPVGSEEHVLGVSLGNWWWVIPPDVVCHSCNHGRLADLDQKLGHHPFIALTRTLTNVPGRSGQPPSVRASNLQIHRTNKGDLQVETNHPRHAAIDGDLVTSNAKWTNIGPAHRKETACALMKVGLGALWLARGPEETSRSRYDHVRDAVLRRSTVPLQYKFGNSEYPNHALVVKVISDKLAPGVLVSLNYFGIELQAQSAGYLSEASPEFIARDTDHEYLENSVANDNPTSGGPPTGAHDLVERRAR
jgi:hypothetical protein